MPTLTPDTKEEQDEAFSPTTRAARELHEAEQRQAFDSEFNPERMAPDGASGDLGGGARGKEKDPDATWKNKIDPSAPTQKTSLAVRAKAVLSGAKSKKGPLAAVVLGLGVGGLSIGGLLATALVNIKESITNRVDSVSSIMGERQGIIFKGKLFDTNTSCAIKLRCRYTGITQNMMDRLNYEGARLVDAEGNAAKKNLLGKYSGAKLILSTGEEITADKYKKESRISKELKRVTGIAMKPRWLAWNDSTAKGMRAAKKITQNPTNIGDPDDKTNRRAFYNQVGGAAQAIVEAAEGIKLQDLDADGNPVVYDSPNIGDNFGLGGEVNPGTAKVDIDGDAKDLTTRALAGDRIEPLPEDIGKVAGTEPYVGRFTSDKLFQGLASAVNPAGLVADLCTVYQLVSATVAIARVSELAQAMRYAGVFFALADKQKAGEISGEELDAVMTILNRPDEAGDTFGDSSSWQQVSSGKIPSKPLTSSAAGNAVIQTMSAGLATVRDNFGGRSGVTALCVAANVLTLTAFIPGVGQLANLGVKIAGGAAKFATKEGAQLAIREAVQTAIKSVTSKVGSRAALKESSVAARKSIGKIMKDPAAVVFALSFFAERYAVPYAAQQIAGTTLGADISGVKALDAWKTGGDAQNAELARLSGFKTTTSLPEAIQATRNNNESLSRYIASERSNANPLDIKNPYSFVGTLSTVSLPFVSKLATVTNGASSVLSLPSALFSTVRSSLFNQPVSAVSDEDLAAQFSYCEDDSVLEDVIKLPNCIPLFIPPDGYNSDIEGVAVFDTLVANGSLNTRGKPTGEFATRIQQCMNPESSMYDEDVIANCYNTTPGGTAASNAAAQGLYMLDQRIINGLDGESDQSTIDEIVSPLAEGFRVTSPFGVRPCDGCPRWHVGEDYINNSNPEVRSIRSGSVIEADKSGGNNVVRIQHSDGLISEYWHMEAGDITVSVGDVVAAGDVIGKFGDSGESQGAHLHFVLDISQVDNPADYESFTKNTGGKQTLGSRIDPAEYFKSNGIAGY